MRTNTLHTDGHQVTRCQLLNFWLAASKPNHTEPVLGLNPVQSKFTSQHMEHVHFVHVRYLCAEYRGYIHLHLTGTMSLRYHRFSLDLLVD